MRTSTAYFAGVGTVALAIAAGLGGGYLAANVISPHEARYGNETRLERRMASHANVTAAPSEPVRYIAATANPVGAPEQAQPQTPAAQAATSPAPEARAPVKADQQVIAAAPAEDNTASNPVAAQSAPPAKPAEQASEKAAPQEAFAKARKADLKREAAEKRRAERHQRWAEKRRLRQPREQELEAVEQKVREETDQRQVFAAEPVRMESPRIRFFDQD